jgi:predicted oxidoreductase
MTNARRWLRATLSKRGLGSGICPPWHEWPVVPLRGLTQDHLPYYAVEVFSGALGTKGGPKIDVHSRAIDLDAKPITGLYAAGNVMASPFGMTYGGPGGTLGPAMVFAYLAGRHAAAREAC